MQVCFIGYTTIEESEELISSLKETIIMLINKGATTFLFSGMSEFDNLSWEVVTELKEEYSFIKRVYFRSVHQYIGNAYEKYFLESYEKIYFPLNLANAEKHSGVELSYEIIDNSTYCVFYYNESYESQIKHKSRHKTLLPSRYRSSTKIAYEYAKKKKKEIINLYK